MDMRSRLEEVPKNGSAYVLFFIFHHLLFFLCFWLLGMLKAQLLKTQRTGGATYEIGDALSLCCSSCWWFSGAPSFVRARNGFGHHHRFGDRLERRSGPQREGGRFSTSRRTRRAKRRPTRKGSTAFSACAAASTRCRFPLAGMGTTQITGIQINGSDMVKADAVLKVAPRPRRVEVTAEAPLVNTYRSDHQRYHQQSRGDRSPAR